MIGPLFFLAPSLQEAKGELLFFSSHSRLRLTLSPVKRSAAVWTGDNAAQWSHLAVANPMLLSLGVAGITFSGGSFNSQANAVPQMS